jgi:hypothetical protein
LPVPIASTTPTPDSLSNVDVISLSTENQLREDFLTLAKTGNTRDLSSCFVYSPTFPVLGGLKGLSFGLSTERERLKSAVELEGTVNVNQNVVSLRNNLNQVLQQNTELKSRLLRIHEASDVTDLSSLEQLLENVSPRLVGGVETRFVDVLFCF